ncbi:hypothetical protein ACOSQ3_027451 [Xanthoceras sorbifolium]
MTAVVMIGTVRITSNFVRSEWSSVDIPLDNQVFAVPKGHHAPQQVRITQGDYDGKGVIISWVTPDEPGSNKVQYGKSENKYDFSAEVFQERDGYWKMMQKYIGSDVQSIVILPDREFQSFFAKGCVILHVSMAVWRVGFERKLDDLAHDWPKHVVGDFALAPSWVLFLVYSWREKYD